MKGVPSSFPSSPVVTGDPGSLSPSSSSQVVAALTPWESEQVAKSAIRHLKDRLSSGGPFTSKTDADFTHDLWKNKWVKTAVIVTAVAIIVGLIASTGGLGLLAGIPFLGAGLTMTGFTVAGFSVSIALITALSSVAVTVGGIAFTAILIRRIEVLKTQTNGFTDAFKGCETLKEFEIRAKEIKAFEYYFDIGDITRQLEEKLRGQESLEDVLAISEAIVAIAKHLDVGSLKQVALLMLKTTGGKELFKDCKTLEQFKIRAKEIKECAGNDEEEIKKQLIKKLGSTEFIISRGLIIGDVLSILGIENDGSIGQSIEVKIEALSEKTEGFTRPFKGCETVREFSDRAQEISCLDMVNLEDLKRSLLSRFSLANSVEEYRKVASEIVAIAEHLDIGELGDALKAIEGFPGHFSMSKSQYTEFLQILDKYCAIKTPQVGELTEEIRQKLQFLFYDRILPTDRVIQFTQTELMRHIPTTENGLTEELAASKMDDFAKQFRCSFDPKTGRVLQYHVANEVLVDREILGTHADLSEQTVACKAFLEAMANKLVAQSGGSLLLDAARAVMKRLIPYIRVGESPGALLEQSTGVTLVRETGPNESLKYTPFANPIGDEGGESFDSGSLVDQLLIRVLQPQFSDYSKSIVQIKIDPSTNTVKIVRVGTMIFKDMGTAGDANLSESVYQSRMEETISFNAAKVEGRLFDGTPTVTATYQVVKKLKVEYEQELVEHTYVLGDGFIAVRGTT